MANFLLARDDGDDLLTAAAPAPAPVNVTLSADQVQPLLAEALARWQAAGVDTSALRGIEVRIADLGGLTLGKAAGRYHLAGRQRGRVGLVRRCDARGGFRVHHARRSGRSGTDGLTHGAGARDRPPARLRTRRIGSDAGRALAAGTRRTIGPAVAEDVLTDAFLLFSADNDVGGISNSLPGRNGQRK